MRVKWAPGEVCNTGGDDYLVPFNDNTGSWFNVSSPIGYFKSFSFSPSKAAPKKEEIKKEETTPIGYFKSFSFSSTKAAPVKEEVKKEETKKEEKKEDAVDYFFNFAKNFNL